MHVTLQVLSNQLIIKNHPLGGFFYLLEYSILHFIDNFVFDI